MNGFSRIGAAAIAAGVVAIAAQAEAANFTVLDLGTTNPVANTPLLGPGVTITGVNNAPIVTGSTINGSNGSNPIGNTVTYTDGSIGWNPFGTGNTNNSWLSVGGVNGDSIVNGTNYSSATLSFAPPTMELSLVWGSPSVTNTISFYDGQGKLLGSVSADGNSDLDVTSINGGVSSTVVLNEANLANTMGPGAIIQISSNVAFAEAVLTTEVNGGGFEVGGVSPVPLPGALPMFLTVLLGVAGFAGFKRFRHGQDIA